MNLTCQKEKGFAVVKLAENRLDASQVESFKDYLFELIDNGENRIILDLASVNFMDSSGLGAVVAVRKKLMSIEEHTIYLACPQPTVSDLLDLTCMDKVFSIFSTVDEALKKGV